MPQLRREIGLPGLVLYGLGTTIGAGIYALTGEVAGAAGLRAPLSLLVAGLLAGVTGLCFAELAGRLPKAAGEAVFVEHAFAWRPLTAAVGTTVIIAGIVAAATVTSAFAGYLSTVVDLPSWLLVTALVTVLSSVAVVGAKESIGAAALFTLVELVGLGLILWTGRASLMGFADNVDALLGPPTGATAWAGVLSGAFIAFFAFLGFEDIDSMAEETTDADVTLPRAIIITLAVTLLLYVAVTSVAVLTVAPEVLSQSSAPMADVYSRLGGNADVLTLIAALAMVNGVLAHLLMIPRVAYGLTNLGLMPAWVGAVSPRTDTPVRGTLIAGSAVAVLAVGVELGPLARLTSLTTILIFIAINASLLSIKRRDGAPATFQVPMVLPVLGVIACVALLAVEAVRLAE